MDKSIPCDEAIVISDEEEEGKNSPESGSLPISISALSTEQRGVMDLVRTGKSVFITGSGGVGKSFLLKEIIRDLKQREKKNVGVSASTGIAGVPIGAITLHSLLGFGLVEEGVDEIITKIRRNDYAPHCQRWKQMNTLVVDEISMISPKFFDTCDRLIREMRDCDRPFGGLQVILVGDFFQLPPVEKSSSSPSGNGSNNKNNKKKRNRSNDEYEYDSMTFCFETRSWKDLDPVIAELKTVFRQNDREMIRCLNLFRTGKYRSSDLKIFKERIGTVLPEEDGIKPTILYSHRANVDVMNQKELDKLPSAEYLHKYRTDYVVGMRRLDSISSLGGRSRAILEKNEKYLLKNCQAPNELRLKIGAQVMLLANLNFEDGLVNGSRGVVTGFTSSPIIFPIVKFANGREDVIPPHNWTVDQWPVGTVEYWQIPLKLAWAITIHKCQGMTLDKVIISTKGIFAHGQTYVALSRAKSLEGMSLVDFEERTIKTHPKVMRWVEAGYVHDKYDDAQQRPCEEKTPIRAEKRQELHKVVGRNEYAKIAYQNFLSNLPTK